MKIYCDKGYGYTETEVPEDGKCGKEATHYFFEPDTDRDGLLVTRGLYAMCDHHAEDFYDSFAPRTVQLTEEEFEVAIVMES